MQFQNEAQTVADSLSLAVAFLSLTDAAGRYSLLLALAFIWFAVLVVVASGEYGSGKQGLLIGAAVFSTSLAGWGIAPGALAVWPSVWGLIALGGYRRAWASLALLPLSGSLIMWLTVQVSLHFGSFVPAATGPIISAVVALLFAFLVWGKAPSWSAVPMVGVSVLGLFALDAGAYAVAWVSCLAISVGFALRFCLGTGDVKAWVVASVAIITVLWWTPYRTWVVRVGGPTVVLLPEASSLQESAFARTENALRHRFPGITIVHGVEGWPEASTVIIPWFGDQRWDELFWTALVDRAEAAHAHLVIAAEHTNLNGFRERMVPVWSTYGLSVGDDTTVPRPNRDFLGHVWQVVWKQWNPSTALSRGGSVILDRGTARPILVGRDWFADGPGNRLESARLGDYRPTRGERQFDIVLVAYGISPSRRSMVTLVADNSPFVDTNIIVQPAAVMHRFADGPASAAALDVFLAVALTIGWMCSSGRVRARGPGICILIIYLGFGLLHYTRTNSEALPFYEPLAEPMGYSDSSSANFRLWWIGLEGEANDVLVVIGNWKDLARVCETTRPDTSILYLGLPGRGTACGASVTSSFRFGRLDTQIGDDRIPIEDGAWARVTLADRKALSVVVGDDNGAIVATWVWGQRTIGVVFDRMSISRAAFNSPGYQKLLKSLRETLKKR